MRKKRGLSLCREKVRERYTFRIGTLLVLGGGLCNELSSLLGSMASLSAAASSFQQGIFRVIPQAHQNSLQNLSGRYYLLTVP